jgi:hypothetical protein
MKKLYVDEHAFDRLSSEKAYILGFLFADCGFRMIGKSHSLSLESIDEPVVRLLKNILKSEHKIHTRKRNINANATYCIDVYSLSYLGPMLEKYGMNINGKYSYSKPVIPDEFVGGFHQGLLRWKRLCVG